MADQLEAHEITVTPSEDVQKAEASEKVRKFMALALARWKAAADHEAAGRSDSLDDWRFSIGQQWPDDIKTNRSADGRPCLTMDHLDQSVKMVTNEERQRRPSIICNPNGSGATREVADVNQGLFRHVEVRSDCEMVYDTVFDHMCRGGFGYMRLITEYLDENSFDQDLRLVPIMNPFSVYVDPASVLPDQTDARYKFIITDIPIQEYKHDYPESDTFQNLSELSSIGIDPSDWASKEAVRVAEYFVIETEERTIFRNVAGKVLDLESANDDEKELISKGVLPKRVTEKKKVMWYKINAFEILESRELPGTYIPVIPILGTELIVNGKRHRRGLIRNAKDPQRAYNYQVSAATEMVALAPKAPWVGAKGQFSSDETKWKSANVRNWSTLEYDPVTSGGTQAPPPQRNVAEPPIQATVALIHQADNDLKASLGIYDASLGQQGPEQSGKAIMARQKQGDLATLNFSDNFDRALRLAGKIMLSYFPVVYDTPRIKRIIAPDGEIKHVGVFAGTFTPEEAGTQLQSELDKGVIDEVFNLKQGEYDVALSVGPNNQTKRMEAASSMMAMVQAYPQLMELAGDLLIGNLDWPYAEVISKRLKRAISPQVLDPNDTDPDSKIAQLTGELKQMSGQHQQMMDIVKKQNELLTTRRMESESRERIALIGAQSGILEAMLKAGTEGNQQALKATFEAIHKRMDLVHENISMEKEAELQMKTAEAQPSEGSAPQEAPATGG